MGDSPAVFSSDSRLEPLEAALIEAVEAGRDFRPQPQDRGGGAFIRGGLIRAMLLGTPLKHHPINRVFAPPREVRVTAHGIRIVQADDGDEAAEAEGSVAAPKSGLLRIAGTLDLRGMGTVGGGFLPPLELSGCIFDAPIELSGSHLQSLTLRDSRFSELRAHGARINGNATFTRCRPPADPVDPGEKYFAARELVGLSEDGHVYEYRLRPHQAVAPGEQRCGCPLCTSPARDWPQIKEPGPCRMCCVIDLTAAQIDGGLDISETYLRAAGIVGRDYALAYEMPPPRDPCALALARVRVRDSLRIMRSTVIGMVRFVSAEVDDDIWISGGRFLASAERPTLDFQLATVGGLLVFQAQKAEGEDKVAKIRTFPLTVVGQISGLSMDAGEIWIGEGFFYGQDERKRGSYPTINFAKADIRRTFKIGCYHDYHVLHRHRPTGPARIHGEICLHAANVGKNLEIHGAEYEGLRDVLELANPFFASFGVKATAAPWLKLSAHGVKVDRRAYISQGSFRDSQPTRDGVAGETDLAAHAEENVTPGAVDFWKSTIGTGFRIGHRSRCSGAMRLNSCVIGREVVINCRNIDPGPAEYSAAMEVPGCIPCLLDISESTIKGHLRIGRHEPRMKASRNLESGESPQEDEAITIKGGVSLHSTNVQGGTLLGHITFDLRCYDQLPPAEPASSRGEVLEDPRVALNLRDFVCGSDLEIHSLRWQLPQLTAAEKIEADREPRGFVWHPGRHRPRFGPISESRFAEIDLRGLQCGMLIDGFGAEWGLIYRLRIRLAGMKVGEVEPASHIGPHWGRGPEERLRWLARQNVHQQKLDETETPPAQPRSAPERAGWWERAWTNLWERHYCSRDEHFVPQAYEVFSSAYRRSGEDGTAEEILVEKKNIQNALRFQRLRELWRGIPRVLWLYLILSGVAIWATTRELKIHPPSSAMAIAGIILLILLWPYVVATFQLIFRSGFRYGLSPNSALFVFFVCIGLGWVGVHVARNGGLEAMAFPDPGTAQALDRRVALVLDVDYEPVPDPPPPADPPPPDPPCTDPPAARPPVAVRSAPPSPMVPPMRQTGHALRARPSPCNLDVNSLLYAIDIFLPLIDLDQERRCTIREVAPGPAGEDPHDDYALWRLAKALYEMLGWIITSLVILTITGVLRRDLER